MGGKRHQRVINAAEEILCIPASETFLEKIIGWCDEEVKNSSRRKLLDAPFRGELAAYKCLRKPVLNYAAEV